MPRGVHNSPRSFNRVDMVGKTYGRLTVLSRAGITKDRKATWHCVCSCGRPTIATGKEMRSGHRRSCGCLLTEVTILRNVSHGKSGTRLYEIWKDMHKRCRHHEHYRGRVLVDPRWDDFPPFEQWALTNGYDDALTLDRKDTLGHYAPENCRWATRKEQANNRYDQRGGYTPAI